MASATFMDPYELNILSKAIQTQMSAGTFGVLNLYQNNHIPTPGDVVGDYTVATFDGYAAVVYKASSGPYRWPDGSYGPFQVCSFPMTAATTPNTIYGCYCLDPTGALAFAIRFDQPVAMVDAFSTCEFILGLSINQTSLVTQLQMLG
jgi:hypothetical protein